VAFYSCFQTTSRFKIRSYTEVNLYWAYTEVILNPPYGISIASPPSLYVGSIQRKAPLEKKRVKRGLIGRLWCPELCVRNAIVKKEMAREAMLPYSAVVVDFIIRCLYKENFFHPGIGYRYNYY
jgi:hypothetical protein